MMNEDDCNCTDLRRFQDEKGYTFRECLDCGRLERLVANGPDDCEWEEAERPAEPAQGRYFAYTVNELGFLVDKLYTERLDEAVKYAKACAKYLNLGWAVSDTTKDKKLMTVVAGRGAKEYAKR